MITTEQTQPRAFRERLSLRASAAILATTALASCGVSSPDTVRPETSQSESKPATPQSSPEAIVQDQNTLRKGETRNYYNGIVILKNEASGLSNGNHADVQATWRPAIYKEGGTLHVQVTDPEIQAIPDDNIPLENHVVGQGGSMDVRFIPYGKGGIIPGVFNGHQEVIVGDADGEMQTAQVPSENSGTTAAPVSLMDPNQLANNKITLANFPWFSGYPGSDNSVLRDQMGLTSPDQTSEEVAAALPS